VSLCDLSPEKKPGLSKQNLPAGGATRTFFPATTHSEDAEPHNLAMLVYSLHQRIMRRFAHEPRGASLNRTSKKSPSGSNQTFTFSAIGLLQLL
jgi:hypothetical protein